MITKEQAIDILEKFDFFQGQRAGRELWNDKPFDVQEQDLTNFSRDVALLKEFISDVAPKSNVVGVESFRDDLTRRLTMKCHGNDFRKLSLLQITDMIDRTYDKHLVKLQKEQEE